MEKRQPVEEAKGENEENGYDGIYLDDIQIEEQKFNKVNTESEKEDSKSESSSKS